MAMRWSMELPVPVYHGLQDCATISGQLCRGGPAVDPSVLHGRIAPPASPVAAARGVHQGRRAGVPCT